MNDNGKTKAQLRDETAERRLPLGELEKSETERVGMESALRESEELYRTLIETSPDPIVMFSLSGQILAANTQTAKAYGVSSVGEFLQEVKTVFDLLSEESKVHAAANIGRILSKGHLQKDEYQIQIRDGSIIQVEINSSVVRTAAGEPRAFISVIRDITERKMVEEALRESEILFRGTFEQAAVGIAHVSLEGLFIRINQRFCDIVGYSREEMLTLTFQDITYPDDLEPDLDSVRHVLEGLIDTYSLEKRYIRKDGQLVWGNLTVALLRDAAGKPKHFISVVEDITRRKWIEEALRKSEERFSKAFNANPAPMTISEIETGRFIDVNEQTLRTLEFIREEMIGHTSHELGIWDDPECRTRLVMQLHREGSFREIPVRFITKSRKTLDVLWSAEIITLGYRKVLLSLFFDITDRRQAEEELKASEERYRVAIEGSNDGIAILKDEQNIFCNHKFLEIFGYDRTEEIVGQPISKVVHPDDLNRVTEFKRLRQQGEQAPSRYEFKGVRRDGGMVFIEVSATQTTYRGEIVSLVFMRDVTERKKLEFMLQQAQKMEAIGTLAGGIAHDFNNILAIIIGCTELSLITTPKDSPIHNHLSQVLEAGYRATDLVQQILTFSRKTVLEKKSLRLSLVIKEILKMMRASLPSTIHIDQHIEPDSGFVLADPTQIHQLLMNLCTNAAHAMHENGGVLTINLSNVDVFPMNQDIPPDVVPGHYLFLTVSDTGIGMNHAVLDRIFEPYFTTKEPGEGTGLGLAVVHGIVKSYGGTILVQSEPGKGTTFQIFLPRTDRPTVTQESKTSFESLPLGREKILFVDDEQTLLKIGKKMLEHLGYEVITSSNSLEALRLFREKPEQFDLVITDMTMPEMTGDRLAQEIIGIKPGFPVILCTGFTNRITKDEAQALGIREFLEKPLAMHILAKTIRKILDQKAAE
ncbi:MAG: PAS domain S-box protein [Syntrophales bacterium LBB04]|nr:PAS domain S-box protein [Syntrophales bacterium LBB04]